MADDVVNLDDVRRNKAEKERVLADAKNDEVMCVITVRADSSINVWVSHDIGSGAQFSWLFGQIAAGTAEIVKMSDEASQ